MEFRVLGPLEVTAGGQSLGLAGARTRAVLAMLLVHANHVVSSDRLIEELWPGQPRASDSLQVRLSELRKALRSAGGARSPRHEAAWLPAAGDARPRLASSSAPGFMLARWTWPGTNSAGPRCR